MKKKGNEKEKIEELKNAESIAGGYIPPISIPKIPPKIPPFVEY
jgi:hypothetical protein